MAIELVPYSDFDNPEDLAQQLHEAVLDNWSLLKQRKLSGPIFRYGGDIDTATEKVEKGQREHLSGELGHFAVIGNSGDVVGSASIYPDLELRKLRFPIPPVLAMGRLATRLPYATPNIHGWIGYDEDGLTEVYKQLLKLSHQQPYHRNVTQTNLLTPWHGGSAWTVEPAKSPHDIHRMIRASKLQKVGTRRYDEGESKLKIPPRGTLYADLRYDWLSGIGRHHELMTGDKDFATELHDEIVSRDPRGFGSH